MKNEIKRLSGKYPSLRNDYAQLIAALEKNPVQGVALGNNCYKICLAIASKGKGKSGGARIISHVLIHKEEMILISIYDKSEKETITNAEIKERLQKYLK